MRIRVYVYAYDVYVYMHTEQTAEPPAAQTGHPGGTNYINAQMRIAIVGIKRTNRWLFNS